MGLIKSGSTAAEPVQPVATPVVKLESGTDAAITRLTTPKPEVAKAAAPAYKQRDFDREVRGKTRCSQYAAAMSSPAIAGLPFKNAEELMVLFRKFADDGTAYTFED